MRIVGFSEVVNDELEKYILNGKTVIVDGRNLFHNLYDKKWNAFIFGTESDRYAQYVRKYLMKFQKANVTCYFVLSGYYNINNQFKNSATNTFNESIFLNDIFKQVLDDMGFEYVVCQEHAKYECIALAQKLLCPIISFDIEYCFSGVDYIPYTRDKTVDLITYNEATGYLECGIFKLNNFMKRYKITERILAVFIVLTDEHKYSENLFKNYFKNLKLPVQNKNRLLSLLTHLSQSNIFTLEKEIKQHIDKSMLKLFNNFEKKVNGTMNAIEKIRDGNIPTSFFTKSSHLQIEVGDIQWFEKGILLKYIATPYINLYSHNTVSNPTFIEENGYKDLAIHSLDIIKYAYDLLKNFNGRGIIFRQQSNASSSFADPLIKLQSISKPNYEANICVFENGWKNIQSLNLFHHFILQTLPSFDFIELEVAPEEARLLIIALIYFTHKKKTVHKNVRSSIILSYVMLAIVFGTVDSDTGKKDIKIERKPFLDTIIDVSQITKNDCDVARVIMQDYFTSDKAKQILDAQVLQPLIEFQHCLQQLNYLNTLCGSPFKPTLYEKTYNGTFVYKILRFMNAQRGLRSIREILNPASTVLAFFNGMIEIYESVLDLD